MTRDPRRRAFRVGLRATPRQPTQTPDTFRATYGRRTPDHPRQVVFAGSTNDAHYLSDPTGSRRFWPILCRTIDTAAIVRDRDQLWAEARVRFEQGEPWHLDTAELRALATAEQSDREERDDWIDIVGRWLTTPTRPGEHGSQTRDVLNLDLGITKQMSCSVHSGSHQNASVPPQRSVSASPAGTQVRAVSGPRAQNEPSTAQVLQDL